MNRQCAVTTYAGYRGEERPVSFSMEGRTFRVREIVDRWYDPDHSCFKVLTEDGRKWLLRHDFNDDCWEVTVAREAGDDPADG
ncbi:MAG: hypothetical protein GYA56_06770 [Geobacteraceae bacterium]|nr:hypothetical protein [Geobacteraceae bacterium]